MQYIIMFMRITILILRQDLDHSSCQHVMHLHLHLLCPGLGNSLWWYSNGFVVPCVGRMFQQVCGFPLEYCEHFAVL